MGRLRRLDAEVVRRKLARSRAEAKELIERGCVTLDGEVVRKPARQIDPAQAIVVHEDSTEKWASRGAYKLLGALEYLEKQVADGAELELPAIDGARCLDAGASTGGFTDVLLSRGAKSVVAVDVGYGQLLWRLREDPRVEVLERTNVRTLTPEQVGELPSVIVSDLSFISLTLVIPALAECAAPGAAYLLMVKPQFEVGKEKNGSGGVVRNPEYHVEAMTKVVAAAVENSLFPQAIAPSPLPGPAGNVEYFVYLRKGLPTEFDVDAAAHEAVANGPAGSASAHT